MLPSTLENRPNKTALPTSSVVSRVMDLVRRDRIRFRSVERRTGPSYELTVPIAFDRLLVSIIASLQVRVAPPTGTALLGLTAKPPLVGSRERLSDWTRAL
jgi:hypothetical protein